MDMCVLYLTAVYHHFCSFSIKKDAYKISLVLKTEKLKTYLPVGSA